MEELIKKIEGWAVEKELHHEENWSKQFVKICEEQGELAAAILKGKREEELDSFGDLLVTIIILALQRNVYLEQALEEAWNVIKNRQGKLVDGTFIKNEEKL